MAGVVRFHVLDDNAINQLIEENRRERDWRLETRSALTQWMQDAVREKGDTPTPDDALTAARQATLLVESAPEEDMTPWWLLASAIFGQRNPMAWLEPLLV